MGVSSIEKDSRGPLLIVGGSVLLDRFRHDDRVLQPYWRGAWVVTSSKARLPGPAGYKSGLTPFEGPHGSNNIQ